MDVPKLMKDDELVLAWRKGDQKALRELMERWQDPLFGYLLKWLGDRAEAEDLFQEVWIRLWRSLPRYQAREQFKALLFTIASNMLRDRARKASNRIEKQSLDFLPEDPQAASTCPLDKLELQERRALLHEGLQHLSEAQRDTLLLRMEAGLSFREIAELKGEKLGTLLPRVHRAVKKLKDFYRERGHEPSA
jgi:RNA polymerase sigma-70 factor (ECF subfamily)